MLPEVFLYMLPEVFLSMGLYHFQQSETLFCTAAEGFLVHPVYRLYG
jgi:hypothetical protein